MRQYTVIAQSCLPLKADDIAQACNDKLKTPGTDTLDLLQGVEGLVVDGFTALYKYIRFVKKQEQVGDSLIPGLETPFYGPGQIIPVGGFDVIFQNILVIQLMSDFHSSFLVIQPLNFHINGTVAVFVPVDIILCLFQQCGFSQLPAAINDICACCRLDPFQLVFSAHEYLRRHYIDGFPYIGLIISEGNNQGNQHSVNLCLVEIANQKHHDGAVHNA